MSEVVGAVLLVAITVVLAGAVGIYLTSSSQTDTTPPSVQMSVDWNKNTEELLLSHQSGDSFTEQNAQAVSVKINGDDATADWLNGGSVDPGDTFRVAPSGASPSPDLGYNLDSGDRVTVVWVPADGNGGTLVKSYEVP